ncbi:TraR/DksA C4-type zinc finger protein [Melghirimyces algeriensis]|uniref:Transcriptional regulator, TraR/DksA family n=1 Tax=Melghirimyces algeriensis TaxID=910412 RepID=A0A521BKV5_9BACL|nr:TraR/DksA C4-type zinc finger protein [Melghirimyces algeriensis]SMO47722.1 transcriptional regulator, TraR/DksA family [Melghirimyces algeriensis]
MTEQQQAELKKQLDMEKSRLTRKLDENQHYGMEEGMNNSVGELSGYDNHPADLGTELFERGKDLALNEEDEERLEAIEMALLRMEEGQYGKCVVCGKEIPYERLKAVPETSYCMEHQRETDLSNRRPVEEKIIHPPFGDHFHDQKEASFYDAEDSWQEVERYGTSNPPDYFREGKDYNELTVDHDERHGYVDDVEHIPVAGLDGRPSDILSEITHNDATRRKEKEEDQEE